MTALKTTSLRLRGTSVDILNEEGLDSEGAVTSKSKLQSKVKALSGVDILTATGEYKSTYEILSQIADVWEDINDMDQAALLELISGKRNSSVIAAILQNPQELKEAFEDASNAEGSALRENEKYLDSIQGRIDLFTNAIQTMWKNTLDSDVVKWFVNLGTEIIKIIDALGLIPSILIAISAISMIKNKMGPIAFMQGLADGITKFNTKVKSLPQTIANAVSGTKQLTAATLEQSVANNALTQTEAIRQATTNGLVLSQVSLTDAEMTSLLATTGLAEAEKQAIITKLGLSSAATTLNLATLQQAVTEGKLTAVEAMHVATVTGLIANETALNAARATKILTTNGVTAAEAANIVTALGLGKTTTALTVATIQQAVANGNLTASQAAVAMSLLATDFTAKGLLATLGKLIVAMWPLLAVGAAIFAIVKISDALIKTTDELTDELNDFKSELQNTQSELNSVNSELETTQSRMAELLAMDSLSFTEKEELENLKKTNDELQRKLDLLNLEKQEKQHDAAKSFSELMNKSVNKATYDQFGKRGFWDKLFGGFDENKIIMSADEYLDYLQAQYEHAVKVEQGEAERRAGEQSSSYYSDKIRELIGGWSEASDGLEYYTGDNLTDEQKQFNEWLDYVKNAEDRWAITAGGNNAKTNAINRIFNKEEFSDVSDEIDTLVAELSKDPTNQTIIDKISDKCKLAEEDLKAVGLSVQDATDYFTQFSKTSSYDTLEGKIKEVGQAGINFENLLKGGKFNVDGVEIGLAELFDEEGKIIQTKLSQVFNDTSEQTRKDITRILEGSYGQIKDGTVDTGRLLEDFGLSATRQILEIQNKMLADQNLELFPNLKDEIDGIIDKFEEFSAAVGDVVGAIDTLEKARAEEAESGSISLETLENLMKYTDDYTKLVEVDETGAIKLAANAEEILVKQRIEKIKADAAAAVQTAQANLQQAIYNEQAAKDTLPIQQALTSATDWLAGSFAYLGSLINDVTSGNFDGMFKRAKDAYEATRTEREEDRVEVTISVEDAQEAYDEAVAQQKIANSITSENIKGKSEAGEYDTVEDVEKAERDKLLDYYNNRIAANQAKQEQIQNEIELAEQMGMKADKSYYDEKLKLMAEQEALLQQKKADLLVELNKIDDVGSDEWFQLKPAYLETNKRIPLNCWNFLRALYTTTQG